MGVAVPVGVAGFVGSPNGSANHFAFCDWDVRNTSVATTVGVVGTRVVTGLVHALVAAGRAFERIAWLWWHEAIYIQRVSTVLATVAVDSKVIGCAGHEVGIKLRLKAVNTASIIVARKDVECRVEDIGLGVVGAVTQGDGDFSKIAAHLIEDVV